MPLGLFRVRWLPLWALFLAVLAVGLRGADVRAGEPGPLPALNIERHEWQVPGGTVVSYALVAGPGATDGVIEGEVSAAFTIWRKWSAADLPVHMAYNPAGEPADVDLEPLISIALSTWSSVPGQAFRFVHDGQASDAPGLCGAERAADGRNTIGWAQLAATTLASTCSLFPDGEVDGQDRITEADIVFNPDFEWSTAAVTPEDQYDLRSTLLHELGHVVGLDHSSAAGAVMRSILEPGKQRRELTADDIAGVLALYAVDEPVPPMVVAARAPALARDQ